MNDKYYDIIILGGGPAGLGSALHLAGKGISVLLLEKEKICTTQKTWLTFDYIVKKYSLEECIRHNFSEIIFSCYLGSSYSFNNKNFIYPLHEEKALKLLKQAAKSKGAIIKDKEPFLNYTVDNKNDVLHIKTIKNTYHTKLAIDAMGRYSPLLKSQGCKNDILDMGCLAFFLKKVNHKNDNKMLLFDSFFLGSDYFWIVPFEDDKMMVGIFFFNALTAHNTNEKIEKLKFYMKARNIKGQIFDTRYGNIPLGGQNHMHTGKFICIGDSCNTPLPSSGFSFSRCLDESEWLADFVLKYLERKLALKNYKKEIISRKFPAIGIHLIISDMLCKFTDPMLNKAIDAMNKVNEEFIISFLTGRDMSVSFSITALQSIFSAFSISELRSLSLKQNYFKQIMNFYNLLPSLSSAKIAEQLIRFAKKQY